jgi:hypothetical protein
MDEEELKERRAAELEFVAAAYSPDEAWTSNFDKVHRRLRLEQEDVEVELVLSMPPGYPVCETAPLSIRASLTNKSSRKNSSKRVGNALPSLLEACRTVAMNCAVEQAEAVFAVLTRADEWVDQDFAQECLSCDNNESSPNTLAASLLERPTRVTPMMVLGRRVIYSHHIIASGKRRALAELTSHYELGGYAKIGWPGVIVIEGLEENCSSFVEEIRTWRWQHLAVRGEEQVPIPIGVTLHDSRVLPRQFEELSEDQLSYLGTKCREAGLHDLFLTCMKIYNTDDTNNSNNNSATLSSPPNTTATPVLNYGALVHVNHMNDGKKYRMWLRRTCQSLQCRLVLKQCFPNDNYEKRPLIIVGFIGRESDVRELLKRWRTSRVDVDSKGKACLERMMTIIFEGQLNISEDNMEIHHSLQAEDQINCSHESLVMLLEQVAGSQWSDAFQSSFN